MNQGITLDAGASSDIDAVCGDSIVNYAWDLDNNGAFETSGSTQTFSYGQMQALGITSVGNHAIGLRLSDTLGATTTVSTTLIMVAPLPATITLSRTTLDVGALAVGASGAAQDISLSNPGGVALDITSIPAQTGDFAISHNCPASLPAGEMCIISVSFHPTAAGTRTASLNIVTSLGTSSVALTGTGAITAESIVADPTTPATLYAGMNGAGIYKSIDSGANWAAATTQPGNVNIKALSLHPEDATKLFAATSGGGVFKSMDSGVNWSACANTGLANLNVVSLAIDAGGKLFAGTEAGVFVSSDGCTTWTAMNNGLP